MKVLVWADQAPRYADKIAANPLPPGIELLTAENEQEALEAAPETEVLVTWGGSSIDAFLEAAPRLRLVQSMGSGVEGLLTPAFIASPVPLSNARGYNAQPIAEHVLALILAFSRAIHVAVRNQMGRRWDSHAARGGEIAGQTLGILGMGAIGVETARRARALGMKIATVRRPGRPTLAEVDEYVADAETLAGMSDYFLVAVPLTPETTGLVDARLLAHMKPTTILINVGRGPTVDEPALIEALQEGRLGGAGLDVTAEEPLPTGSALWSMPNVIITPHVAGGSPHTMNRVLAMTAENCGRLAAGEVLLNLVDKLRGY